MNYRIWIEFSNIRIIEYDNKKHKKKIKQVRLCLNLRIRESRVENGEKTDAVRGLLCYDRTCSDFIVMFYMIDGDTTVQNERSVHFPVIY